MRLTGKKIAVLIESDYYEHEIWYYRFRFPEEGAELDFLTRLWGQPSQTFTGHEHHVPFECDRSFEGMSDEELSSYAAVIAPSGMVADRLRYPDSFGAVPPATAWLARAFAMPGVIKGIICHGLWLCAPMPELVRGRRLTCHPNLQGDARAYGADLVDEDVVVDGDLVTGRTGGHAHLFARTLIERVNTGGSP